MNYKIIASGSSGNALVINDILIDCGVSFTSLNEYYRNLKIVLLTHIHSDHFNKSTIKRLARERPLLRFGCCEWLVKDLINLGVKAKNIDIYKKGKIYAYKDFQVEVVHLYHNVPQCGYKLKIGNKKIIYATDTFSLSGITAKNYDYYFIEANYLEEEIDERIKEKELAGEFAYERDAKYNHLSKEKCDEFLLENMGGNSKYVYMHEHKGA